jgi:hypothetical protein
LKRQKRLLWWKRNVAVDAIIVVSIILVVDFMGDQNYVYANIIEHFI